MALTKTRIKELDKSLEPFLVKKGDDVWKKFKDVHGLDIEGHLLIDGERKWLEKQGVIKNTKDNDGMVIVVDKHGNVKLPELEQELVEYFKQKSLNKLVN